MRKYFLELFAIGLVDSEGRINSEHMTSDALMTSMKTMEELTQMKMDRLVLEKTMEMMGENGISYTLGEDGLYYPDLYLQEETEYPIGKYGMLRKTYLQEHRKGLYLELVLAGKLKDDIQSRVVYIKNWQMHFSVGFLIL